MPTLFTHGIAGVLLGSGAVKPAHWKILLIGALCAVLPDLDSISFLLGIPYANMFGHRGFSHSIVFAAMVSILAALLLQRGRPLLSKGSLGYALLFFIITMSHSIFDALTSGGLGVAFFAPFSGKRYFFDFRPIAVAPVNVFRFFTGRHAKILSTELLWVWIPCLTVAITGMMVRSALRGKAPMKDRHL
jgi:inner membrane protein